MTLVISFPFLVRGCRIQALGRISPRTIPLLGLGIDGSYTDCAAMIDRCPWGDTQVSHTLSSPRTGLHR